MEVTIENSYKPWPEEVLEEVSKVIVETTNEYMQHLLQADESHVIQGRKIHSNQYTELRLQLINKIVEQLKLKEYDCSFKKITDKIRNKMEKMVARAKGQQERESTDNDDDWLFRM